MRLRDLSVQKESASLFFCSLQLALAFQESAASLSGLHLRPVSSLDVGV